MLGEEVRTFESKFELNRDKYELALLVHFVMENAALFVGLEIKVMTVENDINHS